jgi:hypothetical protein
MQWKVIVFETDTGQRLPVLFPAELTHKHLANEIEGHATYEDEVTDDNIVQAVEIANRMTNIDMGRSWTRLKIASAGFVRGLQVEELYGMSETLNLSVDPADLAVINER